MADMHTPLKPCPFCGGDAVEFTERDDRVEPLVPGHSCDVFVSNSYFGVRCERCDVGQTNPFIERSDAIAAWNRRAPSQDAETIKALEAQIATKNAALLKWAEYDQLLRSLPGEGPLYGGQMADVDAAYDACRDATEVALAGSAS